MTNREDSLGLYEVCGDISGSSLERRRQTAVMSRLHAHLAPLLSLVSKKQLRKNKYSCAYSLGSLVSGYIKLVVHYDIRGDSQEIRR